MICKNFAALVRSVMFRGSRVQGAYREDVVQIRPWYGFLYLAKYKEVSETGRVRYKIGITNRDIKERDNELSVTNQQQDASKIQYIWSLPINMEIESRIKSLLLRFTMRNSPKAGATETFEGISLRNLIWIVRLVILHTFTTKTGYLQDANDDQAKRAHRVLNRYFLGVRIDEIRICGVKILSRDEWKDESKKKNALLCISKRYGVASG